MDAIPDEIREQLIALADAGDTIWHETARLTGELLQQRGIVKAAVYSEVAGLLGMKSSAVRGWVRVYKAVGEDLIIELPQFRYTHWRALAAAANRQDKSIAELALTWAATADDYSGMPIPPDALAAKLANPTEERDPFVAALDRAGKALVSAIKRSPTVELSAALRNIAEHLQCIQEEMAINGNGGGPIPGSADGGEPGQAAGGNGSTARLSGGTLGAMAGSAAYGATVASVIGS